MENGKSYIVADFKICTGDKCGEVGGDGGNDYSCKGSDDNVDMGRFKLCG